MWFHVSKVNVLKSCQIYLLYQSSFHWDPVGLQVSQSLWLELTGLQQWGWRLHPLYSYLEPSDFKIRILKKWKIKDNFSGVIRKKTLTFKAMYLLWPYHYFVLMTHLILQHTAEKQCLLQILKVLESAKPSYTSSNTNRCWRRSDSCRESCTARKCRSTAGNRTSHPGRKTLARHYWLKPPYKIKTNQQNSI